MKKLLTILLLLPIYLLAQNPFPVTCTSYNPNGDTVLTTNWVKGTKAGTFSSRVNQVISSVTVVIKPFKPIVTPPPPNQPPTVSVSGPSSITLPVNSVTLTEVASDIDGTVMGVVWAKLSGGTATIGGGNPCLITGLSEGSYTIKATVTDNGGATGSSTFSFTVLPAVVVTPPGTRANLIFESTFEKVTDWTVFNLPVDKGTAWTNAQTCCALNSLTNAPIARAGVKAAGFTLRKNDPDVSGSKRSEITGPEEATFGTTRWYAFSIYLPTGFTPDNTALLVAQWHSSSFNTVPPLKLILENSGWSIVNTSTGNGNSVGDSYHGIGAYTTGAWTDFVIKVTWSNTAGALQVWKNGTSVFSSASLKTSYTGGTYFKTGIYGYGWGAGQGSANPPPYVVYIDEWREGNENATYNDVKPGN